jgi:hypothetical protein
MTPQRLRAPAIDGGVLAEPPLGQADALLAGNLARLGRWDHDFQGRRAGRLREMARHQVLAQARLFLAAAGLDVPDGEGPPRHLIVTGHQPELFHPGVWVKNFAAAALARPGGGAGLNLIVDNDVPKAATIRVPHRDDGRLRTTAVEFDDWTTGEIPYEDLAVHDEARFASFGARVRAALDGQVADPLIEDFWPLATGAGRATNRLGLRLAVARRAVEASWGLHNWEVPLGKVCETEAFLWFASHLLAHLPRFQRVHNEALDRYRAIYGIRSRHHPVPALGVEGEWREAPFWAWRAARPRRRPLLARQLPRTMQLRIAGEEEILLELPLHPEAEACCAVERLCTLPARGVRLRTRALTTTLFARLLLGDLFLHGIGGAKYDELGDEVARRFFGIEPPAFMTLSMTLWPGVDAEAATPGQLAEVERALRDLTFNPDRHLVGPVPTEVRDLMQAKARTIAAPQDTRRRRAARCLEIRRINEALQGAIGAERAALTGRRAELVAGLRTNAVARNREYAFVIHARGRLRGAMDRAVAGAIDAPEKSGADRPPACGEAGPKPLE